MPITAQQKLEILKEVGADPDKYWLDDEGNIIDLPKDTSAMAGIKTAALNLPRTAAGVGGAALGAAGVGALSLPSGPGAVAAGLAGGFTGAAVGSSLGEMFQNAVYPDSVLMAQQARSVRNPGAVQLGDLAAQAVFMRPSVSQLRDAGRGLRAFTTMPSFAKMRPAQASALMDVGTGGAIEAGSTMAQGGDLSEILKNAAIGAVFSNPTGITKTMTRDVFSPHVADQGLRDVVNPADLLVKPGEPVVEKPREVNPELLKAFMKQQKADAKLAEQLAALKANQEAAAKKAQIDAELGVAAPQTEAVLPQNFDSVEARFLRSQAVEPDVEVTLDPQTKPQPKPPVILEPGTPGALDQELGIRPTQSFFDWWAQNAAENYRTRMTVGSPTGTRGQAVSGTTEAYRGADGKRDIVIDKNPYTDTAPHELTHGMILDVLQHGKKGEQAEMRRLLKLAGVDEEAFVQGVGEDVVRRFMSGATTTKTTDAGTTTTTAPGMDDSWRRDFVSFMKYKFGKASPEDVRRIMSNTMLRGGGSKGVSRIVAKPTQQKEEKPPVIPESPRPEVNAEEMAKTYQPVEQPVEAPVNEEFNRSMQETRDRMRVEEMNRQNAERVGSVEVPPVEPYVRRTEATQVEPVPAEPIIDDRSSQTAKISAYGVMAGSGSQGDRIFVTVPVNGVPLLFYRSSKGTSGKKAGNWYPAFGIGAGDWIVKGRVPDMERGYDIPEVRAVMDDLNTRFQGSVEETVAALSPVFGNPIGARQIAHSTYGPRGIDRNVGQNAEGLIDNATGVNQRIREVLDAIISARKPNQISESGGTAQEPKDSQDFAQPRSAELANLPQPKRPVGSARRGAERVAAKEFSKLKKEVRNIDPADLSDVGRPEARTYSGESIPANVRRGRVMAENARESADDLEARRIEARLAGEERPRYQEFGEDRPLKFRQTEGPFKDEVLITKSAKEPGRWQATHMADQGDGTFEPSGHATFDTREEAIRSAQGENVNGPAAGSRTFKLVEDGPRYQEFGEDRTNQQTDTPEFKNWFGDSVVRDETGKPKRVYHGMQGELEGSAFRESKYGTFGRGIYFTDSPNVASDFAIGKRAGLEGKKDTGAVVPVHLSLQHPFTDRTLKAHGWDKWLFDNVVNTEDRRRSMWMSGEDSVAHSKYIEQKIADGTVTLGDFFSFKPAGRDYTIEARWSNDLNKVIRDAGFDGIIGTTQKGFTEYVAFEPTQVKSAIGNRGTFDPNKADLRYQQFGPNRPTSGLADPVGRRDFSPFESASQKAARSANPVIRTVGRALTELFPAQRAMRGKYRALVEAFANLNEKDKDLLYKILIDEYRAGQPAPGTVPARLRKEYNDVRRTLRQMRDDQIKAGQRNSNGVVPGIDDSYFPNVVDPSVRKTLADEIDSPRFKQLKDEFVKFNEANLRSKGATAVKANEEANKLFNRFIGTLNKQPVEGAFDFGAVTLPEGSRLPDNWLHSDPAEAMSQYVRDWSRSRAFHDIVQTNEDVMAGLGQEEFFVNGKKTPVKNRVTPVVKDSNILHLLNESLGIRRGSQDKITGAIGRAASAAWLANPITRSVDIATSLFKGLGMVTPAQIPGLVSNLRNLGKSYERAHDTGWIREDGNTVIGEVLGAGEAFSNGVDKFSKSLSKYTGSEKLENFGRGLAQNIGEYIARTNTALAQSGNKRATDFLDRVAPNWRTLSEAELGTRIGQLFQGRYDATNLPQWLSDSPAAPFFSLARWNIEQWNNFREFAIKPARNGDPVPLISMLVAGIVGGVGIKEIREALSGRKSKIATLKEIAEAPEGSAKYKELVRYYANLAQLSGTIGIVGEIGNMVLDVASKDSPAAPSMPALEVTRDIIPRLIAAGNAMMDGQDPLTVITQMSRDIGNEHVSAYRFLEGMAARTGVSDFAKAELDAANDRRDFRTGKRLRGEPIKAAVQLPIDYSRPEERAMEEERDPVKRRQMALALKAKIKQDPDKDSRERKMRAAATSRPSYLPSIENDPKAFREQLDFVRRTQGEDKVTELKKRYLRDKKNSDSQRKMFNQ